MSTHTPGPWMISRGAQNDPFAIEGPDVTVAHIKMVSTRGRQPEVEANAHLIAAAPELLKALQEILDAAAALHGGADGADPEDVANTIEGLARAAIAKAKGEKVPS